MRKIFSAILCSILLIGSSAYAACAHDRNCKFEGGSFIGLRGPDGTGPFVEDQFIFNADGTVWWGQSTDFELPVTTGSHGDEIGTWKVKGCFVILTTVGYTALPVVDDINDINTNQTTRSTQKFEIIDKNTLRAVHRVFRTFDPGIDPLTAPGGVVLNSFTVFDLRKVKVLTSDLKL